MRALVIGSGGREHALAWKLAQSQSVEKVYVAPGNGGTGIMPKAENIGIAVDETAQLADFAKLKDIGLTVVGPEAPLVLGLATEFRDLGLNVFGPGMAGARLEGSKVFAKNFCRKYGIRTADYGVFNDLDVAEGYLQDIDRGMVVKADGLAAGKGVIVCRGREENLEALDIIMRQKLFGNAGDTVIIEERLQGFEASLMVATDGMHFIKFPYSQDHKRQLDGDQGPNTGGMGVFCPSNKITPEMDKRITDEILLPTLRGIKAEFKDDYRGLLYIGLMITKDGPMVLEFNVRFGDPETQAVLPLCDFDLAEALLECSKGEITKDGFLNTGDDYCLGVVIASNGYPGNYKKGVPCHFLDAIASKEEFMVFHAGTKRVDGKLVSTGGRVAAVCAVGGSFTELRKRIYGELAIHDTAGFFYRKDLAQGLD